MDINSMDINQLKATIDRLNKQSTQVNTVRNQNIGKRKTLEAQCAGLFKQYSEKYGVELTQETLQGEIQRVTAEKEKEVQQLSAVLSAIDSGDYAHANALMGIEYQDEALKEALANNGVSTDRVMQEQEIMSRDFNKPVSTVAAEQMAQRVVNSTGYSDTDADSRAGSDFDSRADSGIKLYFKAQEPCKCICRCSKSVA